MRDAVVTAAVVFAAFLVVAVIIRDEAIGSALPFAFAAALGFGLGAYWLDRAASRE